MAKRKIMMLYGEKTVQVNYRVPESKKSEIDLKFQDILKEYHNPQYVEIEVQESELFKPKKLAQQYNAKDYDLSDAWEQYKKANWWESESVDVEKVLWERFQIIQGIEKKSNPTDDTLEVSVNHKAPEWATKHKQVIKTETSKFEVEKIEPQVVEVDTTAKSEIAHLGYVEYPEKEVKKVVAEIKKDKVKALQEMADLIKNGGGPKNVAFTTVKKPIDEIYDCVIVEKGVPVESDRVYYGTNNQIAFWDRDDATVFYVNWEGKYYIFANSSQFNKFCKDSNLK